MCRLNLSILSNKNLALVQSLRYSFPVNHYHPMKRYIVTILMTSRVLKMFVNSDSPEAAIIAARKELYPLYQYEILSVKLKK